MFACYQKTLISCGFPGVSLCEAESLFELFYRKAAPLHSVSIDSTDLRESSTSRLILKESKIRGKIFIKDSILHTGFLTKSVPFSAHKAPQIEPATCMPASDGAVAHYRIAHIRLHSSESPLQRNSPFDMPLPA